MLIKLTRNPLLFSALCALSLAAPVAMAQVSPASLGVYPVPHQVNTQGEAVKATELSIKPLYNDKDTLSVLTEAFKTGNSGLPVVMGLADHTQLNKLADGMPDKTGAYKIIVKPAGITLIGHDDAGLYYAAQTLTQLGKKSASGELSFPAVTITDWPDIPFRGTVEGFYGKPWSFEDRVSQFEFYGKYKLNTYIYGPKDDPYHGFSNKWREPYPADQAKKLSELVGIAKKHKVNFVWAIHPGRDIQWGEADRKAALKKFEMMYDLGFRSFGVFFDDIGGTAGEPEGQVEFLNYLNREFVRKKHDLTPLVMCPTQYSGRGGKYHEILGQGLDKDIDIMWTGGAIVSNITKENLENINSHTGHKAYIWWNFPVTDYVRHALFLGRVYGLEKGTQDDMSGFVSNPMDKPEASKIALFGIADFTWNQEAFDSDANWHASIKALFPQCAEAMQTFANHNSDAGPSFHNYRREESVDIAPDVAKVLDAAKAGEKISGMKETASLAGEFDKMQKAPATIRAKADNPAFIQETEAWLRAFEELGKAGTAALQASRALENNSLQQALDAALTSADSLDEIDEGGKKYADMVNKQNGDNFQKPVKTGFLVMRPAVEELLGMNTSAIIAKISGRPSNSRRPYVSTSQTDGLEKMFDNDPNSFYYCREILKKDDYFGVDLGSEQEIKTVHIVMGRNDGDTDAVNKGQLEISADGKKWSPLLDETTGLVVNYTDSGKKGRFVRYRCTQPGVPGGKPDVWTAIRDFKVNAPASPSLATNLDQLKSLPLEITGEGIGIKQLLEVAPMSKGGTFGITIPAGANVTSVSFDLKTPDMNWAALETTSDGKTWQKAPVKKTGDKFTADINSTIKGIRLTNTGAGIREIYLQEFKLNYPKDDASRELSKLFDENLASRVTFNLGDDSTVVPCSYPTAMSVVILADGAVSDVYAQGSDDKWSKVGSTGARQSRITTVSLGSVKKPVKGLKFKGASGKTITVSEVIWK